MAGGGEKSVRLSILGNNEDAKLKIAAIDREAEELKLKHPELEIGIRSAAAQEKLAVLRAELKAAGDEAVMAGDKQEVMGRKAAESSERAEKAWGVAKLAILGIGAALGFGIYKAAGYQAAIERIHTQAGASVPVMNQLSSGVLGLAGTVGQNPDSLAEAAYHVASNMVSMKATSVQMLNATRVAAEGAAVGGANLVDVTNALGAAIASGIPGVNNYESAMGMLNATVGAGDMKMQDLAESIGTGVIANIKLYGSTLNDFGAMMATFGDNNIRGEHAGTAVRMAVQALAVQAKTAKPVLAELGLRIGDLGKEQRLHGTVAAIDLLVGRLKAAGIAQSQWGNDITQLFGKKAGAGIGVLIDQYDRLNSKQKVLAEGAHGFGKAWQETQGTAQQQINDLKAGSEALAIQLGLKLLPAAIAVMKGLNGFLQMMQKNAAAAGILGGIIATVLVGLAFRKLEDGIKGSVEGFEAMFKAGKKVVGFTADLASKLLGLGAAEAASEGEAAAAGDSWVVASGKAVAGWAAAGAKMAAQAVLWAASNLVKVGVVVAENVAGAAVTAGAWLVANAAMMLGIGAVVALIGIAVYEIVTHWHTIVEWTKRIWDDVWGFIKEVVGKIVGFVKQHWDLLLGILTGPIGFAVIEIAKHWHSIESGAEHVVSAVTGFFTSLPGRILGALGDLGSLLWNSGVRLIQGLLNGIMNAVPGLRQGLQQITSWIPSWKGPPSADAVLLRPNGRLIMGGLVDGLNDGVPALKGQLQRTTATIGSTRAGAAGSRNNVLTLEWAGGGSDQEVFTYLKKHIRLRGGDPEVLGR